MSAPAFADDKQALRSFINNHAENCAKSNYFLGYKELKSLCTCTVKNFTLKMDKEFQKISENTPEGLALRKKAATEVYAPCMEEPTRSATIEVCYGYFNDIKQIEKINEIENEKKICTCFANDVATYTSKEGVALMEKSLNINSADPLTVFFKSPEFGKRIESIKNACVDKWMH